MPASRSVRLKRPVAAKATRNSLRSLLLLVATILPVAAIALLFAATPAPPGPSSSPAFAMGRSANPIPAAVEGSIVDQATGAPVAGALVSVTGGPQTQSDANGYFAFEPDALSSLRDGNPDEAVDLTISVTAGGYGAWTLQGAVYYPGDTLRLYPRLDTSSDGPVLQVAHRRPQASSAQAQALTEPNQAFGPLDVSPKEVQPSVAGLAPPATIRVYRTQSGVGEGVPFLDYVKHVLPVEWIPTWGAESLKAGAMAAKSYAWYWISRGGKRGNLGADLKDNTDDQVYDPNISYA